MEIFGLFVKKLDSLRRIHELQKFFELTKNAKQPWRPLPKNRSSNNTSQTIDRLPPISIDSLTTTSLVSQNQSYAHLAAQAAISYWLSSQNPNGITMSYGRFIKSSPTNTHVTKAVTSHL